MWATPAINSGICMWRTAIQPCPTWGAPLLERPTGPATILPIPTISRPRRPPPYGSSLSVFNGTDPNGAWNLYIVDDYPLFSGFLNGGWCLTLYTGPAGVT